ncbi:MAG: CRISPR-associated protein Cas4 [Telmatospirillum sp.]|nr:CRISPR-associated protein Cas4 [Telmatospirillum sp.]
MSGDGPPLHDDDRDGDRDGDPIPLSALQHAVYCLRQAALIHLERLWEENRFTAEGHVLHISADKMGERKARGVRRVMALPLSARSLGIAGTADLVEFHKGGDETQTAYPVEYKRGKAKLHRADEVQLCAQALCLEEMTGRPVPEGALYYAETKRRVVVSFDEALRVLTRDTIADLRRLFASRETPPPVSHTDRCRACSLVDLCRPKAVARPARQWRDQMLNTLLSDDGAGA